MNKKGFISSALLYGILALFLIIMLSTIAVLGNRKLNIDKLKENAAITSEKGYQSPETIYALYDAYQEPQRLSGSGMDEVNIWRDMSGNGHNITMGGYIYYGATDVAIGNPYQLSTGIRLSNLGNEFTITTVVENITEGGIWGNNIYASIDENGLNVCYITNTGSEACKTVPKEQYENKKINLTAVYQNKKGVYVYINGTNISGETSTGGAFPPKDNSQFYIGIDNFKGKLYGLVINKKALTDEEIVENYNYVKERYNI